MNEEIDELIRNLYAAGATDEEVEGILAEYLDKSKDNPVEQVEEPVQADPTFGETATHAIGTFNKVVTDTAPQLLQGAGMVTSKAADLLRQGTNAIGLTDDQVPITPESNPLYQAGQGLANLKAPVDHTPDPRLQDSFLAT